LRDGFWIGGNVHAPILRGGTRRFNRRSPQ
jgi:hypothetical protein